MYCIFTLSIWHWIYTPSLRILPRTLPDPWQVALYPEQGVPWIGSDHSPEHNPRHQPINQPMEWIIVSDKMKRDAWTGMLSNHLCVYTPTWDSNSETRRCSASWVDRSLTDAEGELSSFAFSFSNAAVAAAVAASNLRHFSFIFSNSRLFAFSLSVNTDSASSTFTNFSRTLVHDKINHGEILRRNQFTAAYLCSSNSVEAFFKIWSLYMPSQSLMSI